MGNKDERGVLCVMVGWGGGDKDERSVLGVMVGWG